MRERDHVVTIDDAPLLDDQSVAVLHQLCAAARIPLLATARSTDEERETLSALWKEIGADRMIVEPLDERDAAILAGHHLDDAPDSTRAEAIVRRSAGNPLFIGELARAELDEVPGGLTPRLRDIVGARISRLDDSTRHQLLLIAVADPLDTDLDAADGAAIERLEAAGLVSTDDDRDAVLARPAHSALRRDRALRAHGTAASSRGTRADRRHGAPVDGASG